LWARSSISTRQLLYRVKRYETQLACQDGAAEIDMVINLGKASAATGATLNAMSKQCAMRPINVVRESSNLRERLSDQGRRRVSAATIFKKNLCQICERAGADWVKPRPATALSSSRMAATITRATEQDLALMRASVSAKVQVKAAGGIRDLDGLIKVRDLGGSRCAQPPRRP